MNAQEKIATKELILEKASHLFAHFGYGSTSIRDIANACDVNVAAINYHFKSKSNLYWASVERSYLWLDKGIAELSQKCESIEELIAEAFALVMADPDYVRSVLKMMLTDGVADPDEDLCLTCHETHGPPGQEHFLKVLSKQVDQKIHPEAMMWAAKSIFGSLLHWSLMATSTKFESMKKAKIPWISQEKIQASMKLQASAIVDYMIRHQDKIKKEAF